MSGARVFTVLSREWCHLCHELVEQLAPLAAEFGWSVEVIDVDRHPELEARWDELVPVLLVGDIELCHYHLDEAVVRAYCRRFPLESAS
jgi:glutaredoxin